MRPTGRAVAAGPVGANGEGSDKLLQALTGEGVD